MARKHGGANVVGHVDRKKNKKYFLCTHNSNGVFLVLYLFISKSKLYYILAHSSETAVEVNTVRRVHSRGKEDDEEQLHAEEGRKGRKEGMCWRWLRADKTRCQSEGEDTSVHATRKETMQEMNAEMYKKNE